MTYTALLATVYYAVKSVVDPTILPNAGLARPLHDHGARGQHPQLRRIPPRSTAGCRPASASST